MNSRERIDRVGQSAKNTASFSGRSFILCGLPACGKSTIGKALADRLGHAFIDTDSLIEEAYLKSSGQPLSCRQIAAREGNLAFRALEKHQINQLPIAIRNVISLGGGAICDPENQNVIKDLGCIIYLKTPIEVVWKRLQLREMPTFLDLSAPELSFQQLAKERMPLYEKVADVVIEAQEFSEGAIIETILGSVHYGQ